MTTRIMDFRIHTMISFAFAQAWVNVALLTNCKEEGCMAFLNEAAKHAYWRANIRLVLKLLSIWFVVSFGCGILLVDWLNSLQVFGFKLGFWFAQQGAIYVFVLLIFVYVHKMNQLDKRFNVDEK